MASPKDKKKNCAPWNFELIYFITEWAPLHYQYMYTDCETNALFSLFPGENGFHKF